MIRTLGEHRCTRHHRSPAALARCLWPDAAVTGRGSLAVARICDQHTVVLFERLAPARTFLTEFDVFGCCPICPRDHELLALDIDANQEAAP